MIDVFALLVGLFIGLFSGVVLGAMTMMLIFMHMRVDVPDDEKENVSTDDETHLVLQHL